MATSKTKTPKPEVPDPQAELKAIHAELVSQIPGGGTVEIRQALADRLAKLIEA